MIKILRKSIFRIHLILGILLGLYAFLIGVTGSILVYREELTEWVHPQFFETVTEVKISADSALATVRQAYPNWRALTVTGPELRRGAWMVYLLGKDDALEAYVDAASGRLRGVHRRGDGWLGAVAQLHFNLMGGRTGRLINGYAGFGLMLLALTGVALWRPRRASWQWRPRPLHANLGLVTSLFIVIMGFTGGYFVWFKAYVDGVRILLPAGTRTPLRPIVAEGSRKTFQELADAAKQAAPTAQVFRIPVGGGPKDAVKISMRHGTMGEFQLVSHVTLNPYTAEVLRLEPLADRAAGDRLIGNFSAVHFGVWGGQFGRALWAMLGLSLPVLFLTSLPLWWRRLRQK